MAEPEIEKRSDRADPITIAAVVTKRTSQTSDTNGATSPAEKPAPDALTREAAYSKAPDYLDDALKHAERLLKYAAGNRHPYRIRHSQFHPAGPYSQQQRLE